MTTLHGVDAAASTIGVKTEVVASNHDIATTRDKLLYRMNDQLMVRLNTNSAVQATHVGHSELHTGGALAIRTNMYIETRRYTWISTVLILRQLFAGMP